MSNKSGDYEDTAVAAEKAGFKVTVAKNGPYLVSGNLPLKKEIIVSDKDGESVAWCDGEKYPDRDRYALCRCGKSGSKPFCDGAHEDVGFDGNEMAAAVPYNKQAAAFDGPELVLTDAQNLCAVTRFCHPGGGTWRLTQRSSDPEAKKQAIQEACNCPSGRLVVWDRKTRQAFEPDFEPSISLIEDPEKKVSGPIWLKGGIPLESSSGTCYETRNRVTLCRCGGSRNKPFCDGTHCENGFDDGDESIRK
jgi:CDGSH-type Zn-finger protein